MSLENRQALSALRLERAQEAVDDANMLLTLERYNLAANRAYYAVFYAMRAVLALDGIDRKHHSAVIAEFRRLYIQSASSTPGYQTPSGICSISAQTAITTISLWLPKRKWSNRPATPNASSDRSRSICPFHDSFSKGKIPPPHPTRTGRRYFHIQL